MATLTKFSIAPDGRLVYRSNGSLVRGQVTYSLSRDLMGSGYSVVGKRRSDGTIDYQRVYKNGRLVGYVGKPNKTQAKRIYDKAINRAKRKPDNRAIKEKSSRTEAIAIQDAIDYGGIDLSPRGGWDAVSIGKRALDNYRTGINTYFSDQPLFISYQETRMYNYASALSQAVDLNILTVQDANNLWLRYTNVDEETRSQLWRDLNQNFNEEGFTIDSPPLYDEMARDLQIDLSSLR